jgi:transcriptional regulator with XRE-family HTH domain
VTAAEKKSRSIHESLRRILKQAREERGWSQRKLAREAGLASKAISFIEDGDRLPKLDTLVRITEALGVSLSSAIADAGG